MEEEKMIRRRQPLFLLLVSLSLLLFRGEMGGSEEKESPEREDLVRVEVKGVTLQPLPPHVPVMVLLDRENRRVLPIVIGAFEARAIAWEMEHITAPRPMTHDLIKNILEGIKVKIKRVVITDLRGGTFYATISLITNGPDKKEVIIDSRPSDAIAIALRVKSPIYVKQKVMEDPSIIQLDEQQLKEGEEHWERWLEEQKLEPEPRLNL